MNAKASEDSVASSQALDAVSAEILSYLDGDEQKGFAAAQEAWATFRDLDTKAGANRWGKGGTIWGTLYPSQKRTTTLLRIEELNRELATLRELRSAQQQGPGKPVTQV